MDPLKSLFTPNFDPMKFCTEFLEKKEILTLSALQTALDGLYTTLEREKTETFNSIQTIQAELREQGTQAAVSRLRDTQSRAQKELDTSHLIIKKV